LLKAAIAISPDEPRAWLILARAYLNEAGTTSGDREPIYALSRQAAEKAVALDPNLGVAYTYLGRLDVLQERGLQTAADHYSRALALEPDNPGVLSNATVMLGTLGRTEDILTIRRWLVSMIRPPHHADQLLQGLVFSGRYRDAVPPARSRSPCRLTPSCCTRT